MKSWDKQRKESYEQFDAFSKYRDNTELRSLDLLAANTGKGRKQLSNWVNKFSWESRAVEFDKIVTNIKSSSLEQQISSLGEKQAKQIIEVANSLDDLSNAIRDKMILSSNKIDEKKLEALLKLISSYMKSMTDIHKIFHTLRTIKLNLDQKEEKFPFENVILNDKKSYLLASELLSRVNEVRDMNST